MVEAVALALVDELTGVPRQESEGILRFDETLVGFGVEHAETRTGLGVVGDEVAAFLRTRHFHDVEAAAVGAPTEVGEIAIGGIAEIEPDGAVVVGVEDADGDLVGGHTGHGVFLGRGLGDAHGTRYVDVDERIVGDHALIHAIEGEPAAVGAPEGAFVDAKFVAVHGGAVEQFAAAVGRNGVLATVGGGDVEIIVLGVGQGATCRGEVLVADAALEGNGPFDATIFPIIVEEGACGAESGDGAAGFGEGGGGEGAQHAATGRVERCIDLSEGEKARAFRVETAAVGVAELRYLRHVGAKERIPPPSGENALGLEVPIVGTAPHQVVECGTTESRRSVLRHAGERKEREKKNEDFFHACNILMRERKGERCAGRRASVVAARTGVATLVAAVVTSTIVIAATFVVASAIIISSAAVVVAMVIAATIGGFAVVTVLAVAVVAAAVTAVVVAATFEASSIVVTLAVTGAFSVVVSSFSVVKSSALVETSAVVAAFELLAAFFALLAVFGVTHTLEGVVTGAEIAIGGGEFGIVREVDVAIVAFFGFVAAVVESAITVIKTAVVAVVVAAATF